VPLQPRRKPWPTGRCSAGRRGHEKRSNRAGSMLSRLNQRLPSHCN